MPANETADLVSLNIAAPIRSVSDMRYDPKTLNRSGVYIYNRKDLVIRCRGCIFNDTVNNNMTTKAMELSHLIRNEMQLVLLLSYAIAFLCQSSQPILQDCILFFIGQWSQILFQILLKRKI